MSVRCTDHILYEPPPLFAQIHRLSPLSEPRIVCVADQVNEDTRFRTGMVNDTSTLSVALSHAAQLTHPTRKNKPTMVQTNKTLINNNLKQSTKQCYPWFIYITKSGWLISVKKLTGFYKKKKSVYRRITGRFNRTRRLNYVLGVELSWMQ